MAENNLIKKADLARVREVDFVERFQDSVKKLVEMLGITRKVQKTAGAVLKSYRATGTLQSGIVGEGETIPLSHYETEAVNWGEITLKKWRKSTSAEAIVERGYDQAVGQTTDKMLKDVQKGIRGAFVDFLATGEGAAYGADLQDMLAHVWGQLQVLFEDDDAQAVYFVNPLDVADYLGAANITVQTAFGLNYVEDFLGLGTVIVTGLIPKGTVYGTVSENIILYYIPVNGADLGEAFNFTSDSTGYIGIHEAPDYNNMTASDTVVSGIALLVERIDGIVVGTIGEPVPFDRVTISPAAQDKEYWGEVVSDFQDDDIAVNGTAFTGTLKNFHGWPSGTLAGEGYFMALKFSDVDPNADTVKVGLVPSATSMELQELDEDMDAVFKIADKDEQKLRVDVIGGSKTTTTLYDLSGLTLEE